MSDKVTCGICTHETNSYCGKKKCKIKPNKRRQCDIFELDTSRVKIKQPIESIKRPDFFWDEKLKKQMRRDMRKKMAGEMIKQVEESTINKSEGDIKHPLTGDLSKFKTTSSSKER